MVESIHGHRGNQQRRSTMEFKVRWTGLGESCDSWEPYKALLHVDNLHDHLRANAMKTSRMYGEMFTRVSSEFLPKSARRRVFPRWFLVGKTPHISVHYFLQYPYNTHIEYGGPSSERRGIATQMYVLVLSVSIKYVLSVAVYTATKVFILPTGF